VIALVLCLLVASAAFAFGARWRHYRMQDRALCGWIGQLVHVDDREAVTRRLHEIGRNTDDRLGRIVRSADGGGTSLDLTSEEYDYVVQRCQSVGKPAPNVDPASQTPAQFVSAYVCDVSHKPTDMLIACGDGNVWVRSLRWSTWTSLKATGVGTWQQNNCLPDCARGRFLDYPVTLTLSEPMTGQGTTIFGSVEAQFGGPAPMGKPRVVLMVNGHYAP
jgi:hypothetical protein